MSILKHLRAILLLPVMVTIIIPGIITGLAGHRRIGWCLSGPLRTVPVIVGCTLMCLGIALVAATIRLFATVGRGTLAPWDPTQQLVVRGVYLHVRNPMIGGVCSILLGEAVLLGSIPLLVWFGLFAMGNLVYIPLVEERDLARRFGDSYVVYEKHVPAWIPRLRPWDDPILDDPDATG